MRPIDADALMDDVEQSLQKNPHKDGAVRANHRTEHMHFLDLIRKAPIIAPPPNEPLTLEELQEMDGEPVYIVSGIFKDWRIPDFSDEGAYRRFVRFTDRSAEPMNSYGKTWLAYRRETEDIA